MTIEEKLKDYILDHYKSIREFTQTANLPYTTVDGILKRGIANSSISNVLKICSILQISADELANDRIVPINNKDCVLLPEIPETLSYIRSNLDEYSGFTIDGIELTSDELNIIIHSMSLTCEFIRAWRQK